MVLITGSGGSSGGHYRLAKVWSPTAATAVSVVPTTPPVHSAAIARPLHPHQRGVVRYWQALGPVRLVTAAHLG